MECKSCGGRQEQFGTELCIHFSGIKNLNKPHVYESLNLLICMKCGISYLEVSNDSLRQLQNG